MKLLVIRHGKASARTALTQRSKQRDAARPLTKGGRKTMSKMAKALRALTPDIDILASSTLVRAKQTADIIAATYGDKSIADLAELTPGAGKALLPWLARQKSNRVIAIVGHEPDLSRLVGLLVGGEYRSCITLKKGAVCCIAFPQRPGIGRGLIAWLLAPEQVRDLT